MDNSPVPTQYAIVATWEDPEVGVVVYGPYPSEDEAKAALPGVTLDFSVNYTPMEPDGRDVLPDDVVIAVQPMCVALVPPVAS